MSDSSRHALFAILEITYGTMPSSPAFTTVRNTGVSLSLTAPEIMSEELRSDRQIVDVRSGNRQVTGTISCELSYSSYDAFIEATLLGTWTAKAAPYVASTLSAAASDNSINDSANGLPVLDPGDKVTISGFTGGSTTANQTDLTVVTSTISKMVLSGGVAFINDAAGEAVTITTLTDRLKAGTTRRSFSLLRNFADLADGSTTKPWHSHLGCEFNGMTLTISAEKLTMVEFSVIGQNKSDNATAPGSATYIAAATTTALDAFTGTLKEGGASIATVTELQIKLENGISPRFVVGTNLTRLPTIGQSKVSGQLTAFFEDSALLDKFLAGTTTSVDLTLKDAAGNALRIYLPAIKYTGEKADVKGQGPIPIVLPFVGFRDSTTATNILFDRNAA